MPSSKPASRTTSEQRKEHAEQYSAAARYASEAFGTFLIGGGVIYLLLWIYGLLIDQDSAANFVPLNAADNWLHLLLAVGLIAAGLLLGRRTHDRTHDRV